MRIVIHGFGRIGRVILRQILTTPDHADIEVVAVNDLAAPETCAYLFKYDSVFGPLPGGASYADGDLLAGGRAIPILTGVKMSDLPLDGVDLLLDCTGATKDRASVDSALAAGARAVLISGPSDIADITIVKGANENEVGDCSVVSNASCTTNAVAPLLRDLDTRFGLIQGHMTTIHCYTGSQPMVDAPRGPDLARNRAGAVSMVPTTTSAAKLVDRVLPDLAGRVTGAAVRVPAISVSAVDLVVRLSTPPTSPADALRELADANPVVGLVEDACVSVDLRGRTESLVIAPNETLETGDQLRIFGWYDNEWGFSARMLDVARMMHKRGK
ncbi:glyceraldehyde 3-phosphate dehydrogenase NAD-binding domain-containing protein [Marivita sp. XM-24bin2]|jgi:glyceraldehyde 3-phosphate dehydrogenase|uniref:type I glyceraldehyde-3-phosphate dehydrogenase n=1 Tax=unclassified Marivita TaxID=2632480 RepID=UPI000D78E252|nr:glyceraldehyde 3-phosphate dehydrogenase NAD-binding domain-containing protein [Marivita sp. XM-24bin2]MCR9108845.1 glyceraldehyde-3-phosphate dehydrogenase [Paracoccaceae bacterium]PWL34904.1 MAG: glyceraldehyde-3-phosphate dehydrogenase [Marivita sp. XM-24bin2]